MLDTNRPTSEGPSPGDSGEPRLRSGIDRYELERVVGSGAMGVVYRATDRVLGRRVAIKTIRDEIVSRDRAYQSYKTRFYREASIFGSLSHANIVALYDVGETHEGVPFLAMEYVAGASLAELRKRGRRLTLDESMWLLAQLASGLDYAHANGVIHRDIKPSNILVGEGEEAKIADFGVAKLMGEEFTQSRTRFGTPGYMSPEQVLGRRLTKSVDLFSLGVVAFELLSGECPFPGEQVHTILYKLVHVDPVFPAALEALGLVPERWQEVFARALAKDPEERFPTASELVSSLVELFPGSWLGNLMGTGSESTPEIGGTAEPLARDTVTLGSSELPSCPDGDDDGPPRGANGD
jgi:eukaryotic-like serine/threonine-protein kinase